VEEALGGDVVVVAGGIGLAPLRPVLYRVFRRRRDYGRVALLYGARNPEEILYRRELDRWGRRSDVDVHVTVDRAEAGWGGNVGVVTTLISKVEFDAASTVVMVCGPEIMMRFTVLGFQNRGVPSDKIYISMERNMQCGLGYCGHCQLGPYFVCKDGPVFRFDVIGRFFGRREI
jgi:NAD(P)H-flavin reductase